VSNSTTDGFTGHLQNLEWLSLDVTRNITTTDIEQGKNNTIIEDGWQYATRMQSETHNVGLWGGTDNEWTYDKYQGAATLLR